MDPELSEGRGIYGFLLVKQGGGVSLEPKRGAGCLWNQSKVGGSSALRHRCLRWLLIMLRLNLRWDGLNFSRPPHFPLTEEPKDGPNHGSSGLSNKVQWLVLLSEYH